MDGTTSMKATTSGATAVKASTASEPAATSTAPMPRVRAPGMGLCTVTSLVPSGNVASTCTSTSGGLVTGKFN